MARVKGNLKREKRLNVERIWQRQEGIRYPNSACGPTVAAMIVKYLRKKEVLPPLKVEDAELVNLLYKKIGSLPWGTSVGRWQKGMETYFNRHLFPRKVKFEIRKAVHAYSDLVRAIDRGYPVLLRFTFNFSPNSFASHHYVLGVGYRYDDEHQYVACLDSDGGKDNDTFHWLSWEEQAVHMKMATLWINL